MAKGRVGARRRVFVPPSERADREEETTPKGRGSGHSLEISTQEATDLLGALLESQDRASSDVIKWVQKDEPERAEGARERGERIGVLLRRVAELVIEHN